MTKYRLGLAYPNFLKRNGNRIRNKKSLNPNTKPICMVLGKTHIDALSYVPNELENGTREIFNHWNSKMLRIGSAGGKFEN